MPIQFEVHQGRVPIRAYTNEMEDSVREQLINVSKLPVTFGHIAAMPDVHVGIGAAVGSVIPTRKAIIPSAVGVDIGCGMLAVQLSLTANELPDSLTRVREAIESAVPVGFSRHRDPKASAEQISELEPRLMRIREKHPRLTRRIKNFSGTWPRQLGTLGGGNHFIELCLDEDDQVWVMLHSGSRGVGNAIGNYFIQLAKKDMGVHLKNLPDQNLAYLSAGTQHFDDYWEAVDWAQDYARENRELMLTLILNAMRTCLPEFSLASVAVNCHHNYVAKEVHFGKSLYITRKGAIRAGQGEMGIIPGSMGVASYIVRGKGRAESFQSCAHGAGRKMSRNEARQRFSVEDLRHQTAGVECRKDKGVLDEIPQAYKDIDQVMKNQDDLVEIVHKLKQVVCIKG